MANALRRGRRSQLVEPVGSAPPQSPTWAVERAIRRERVLVILGLVATTALAWIYLLREAGTMAAMAQESQMHAAMGMADMAAWGGSQWVGLFVMWAVMMGAMMLPSASPVILLVLGVYRRRQDPQARVAAIAFGVGYLLAWTAFSAAAASVQVLLHRAALLANDMRVGSGALAGAVLVVAGVYQWLPIKAACLTHCHSPLGYLSQHWREGPLGGISMGLRQGLFCVGCCWLLMTLLFVVGVMNLYWVAALTVFVLIEKLVRGGTMLGRAAGTAAAAWGLYLLVSP
jgi:predicted metal-binding membrane protein